MNKPQSLQEKIIKGSFIAILLTFVGSVFAYLIRIVLSRNLNIEDYGLFYAVFGLFSVAVTYMDLGFGYSIVYFFPKYIKSKEYSKAWNIFVLGQMISLLMSVVMATVLIIAAPFLAKNYFRVAGSEIIIYIFCAYLIAFSVINGLIQIYSGLQKAQYYSSITTLRWFLTFAFSIIIFLLGFSNIVFFVFAWVFGHILTAVFFLFLLFYKHSFLTSNKIVFKRETLKTMFAFALPYILETFVGSAVILSDTFFLTLFKGVRSVGIYNIIYPLAFIPVILIAPINTLLLPLVSHLMEGEKEKMKFLVEKILVIIPFVGLYFALFIAMFPSATVGLIFGKKWLGLTETPLIILSLGSIAVLMNGILGAIASGAGKIREKLRVAFIVALISVCLDAFLIWHYGIMGAVITLSLSSLALSLLFVNIIRDEVFVRIPYLFYLKMLAFSVTLYLIMRQTRINPQGWFEFIILGIVYTIAFIIFGLVLKVYDKKLLMMILPKR